MPERDRDIESIERAVGHKLTPAQRRLYKRRLAHWDKKLKPIIDSIKDSQRITAKDLAITINCKG